MKTENVFANEVCVDRPPGGESVIKARFSLRIQQGRDIAQKGIKPDIEGLAGIVRQRDTPGNVGPGDWKVFETLLDKVKNFVAAEVGLNESWLGRIVSLKGGLIARKTEEVVRFVAPFAGFEVGGTDVAFEELGFVVEGFTADTVPALLLTLIDIAVIPNALKKVFDDREVAGVSGAAKTVVTNAE